ncbi:MAG: hypothetical protein H7061_01925 [Bdellovibrionaceae bacterium]|nr:hypothetical protein [Bdellovibrio sp.]
MNNILLIHAFSCWFMTGAIWLVQVLVYPFFRLVGEKEFTPLHQFHMKQITWVVAPVMLVELVTSAWLLYSNKNILYLCNFVSVGSLWIMTAFINVPTHNKLRFSAIDSKYKLVSNNWPRTVIWTFRSLILIPGLFCMAGLL